MRLDARTGDTGYFVWHAERCEHLRNVVWVDDQSNQWFAMSSPLAVVNGEIVGSIQQARRIDIFLEKRLVLIDRVPDADAFELLERAQQGFEKACV